MQVLIASTYDNLRNTCLWLLSTWTLYHYSPANAHVLIIIWVILSMQRPFIRPYAYSILIMLFPTITTAVFISLMLLFHYYCYYKMVTTDKLLWTSPFPGAGELTTHLLTNILWLPLCRINKFGFHFPRRLSRSPILVGHHQGPQRHPRHWDRKSVV